MNFFVKFHFISHERRLLFFLWSSRFLSILPIDSKTIQVGQHLIYAKSRDFMGFSFHVRCRFQSTPKYFCFGYMKIPWFVGNISDNAKSFSNFKQTPTILFLSKKFCLTDLMTQLDSLETYTSSLYIHKRDTFFSRSPLKTIPSAKLIIANSSLSTQLELNTIGIID